MKNYSNVFALNSRYSEVVLVRKNRPAWQNGLLNAVGGKVDADETYLQCAIREFKEETSVDISEYPIHHFADLVGVDYKIGFFLVILDDTAFYECKTTESEQIDRYDINEILTSQYDIVNNTPFMLSICMDFINSEGKTFSTLTRTEKHRM